jgi:hypothetical protein
MNKDNRGFGGGCGFLDDLDSFIEEFSGGVCVLGLDGSTLLVNNLFQKIMKVDESECDNIFRFLFGDFSLEDC